MLMKRVRNGCQNFGDMNCRRPGCLLQRHYRIIPESRGEVPAVADWGGCLFEEGVDIA